MNDEVALSQEPFFRIELSPSLRIVVLGQTLTTAVMLEPQRWYHVALVIEAANFVVYVNGAFVAFEVPANMPGPNIDDIFIGRQSNLLGGGREWVGRIDGLRLWRERRSNEQLCDAAGTLCNAP